MGLDITAYSKLEWIRLPTQQEIDGEVDCGENLIWLHQDLIESSNGFGPRCRLGEGIYSYAETFDFCAGSYGGYNSWRNQLADFAGHSGWDQRDSLSGPLAELIYFSDCEGIIDSTVAEKLNRDFVNLQDKLTEWISRDLPRAHEDSYFVRKFRDWHKAFLLASDGGCVKFH